MAVVEGSFRHNGHRIAFADYGEGDRVLVLAHGLLMNRHMYDHLAPEMASRGIRVIALDLLGHGASDKPTDMRAYSMTAFADQVAALIDHLELDRPAVGGTSLGANVALELAARHPSASRALFIEMPVLENALVAAGLIFLPILVTLRVAKPLLRVTAAITNRIPRSNYLLDITLDWTRRPPEASEAVLEGLLFGRTAPPREERELIGVPALVIGHPADPLHPFTDSDMLVEELPLARLVNAESIFEWRVSPGRLDDELARFVVDVYDRSSARGTPPRDPRAAVAPARALQCPLKFVRYPATPMSSKSERERRRAERLAAEKAEAESARRRLMFGYAAAGVLTLAVVIGIVIVIGSGGSSENQVNGQDIPGVASKGKSGKPQLLRTMVGAEEIAEAVARATGIPVIQADAGRARQAAADGNQAARARGRPGRGDHRGGRCDPPLTLGPVRSEPADSARSCSSGPPASARPSCARRWPASCSTAKIT